MHTVRRCLRHTTVSENSIRKEVGRCSEAMVSSELSMGMFKSPKVVTGIRIEREIGSQALACSAKREGDHEVGRRLW